MSRKKPFVIGLTGSIGMGKSTTAKMFADQGIPVWDADAAVARLYSKGGAAVAGIDEIYPPAVKDGEVQRDVLRQWIAADALAIEKIEKVVHPLVAKDRESFLNKSATKILVLDVPLLFEIGAHKDVDMVVVVSVEPEIQKSRVLARPQMTQDQFDLIISKQMPDAEKRKLADVVIDTTTLAGANEAVQRLINKIKGEMADA